VTDNPVHHGIFCKEGDDVHMATALGAEHGIDLVDLADHRGPALGGEALELVLNNPQRKSREARLVYSTLGQQEVEMGMKIDPVPKCLNGRNDSGSKLAPG
jgi:hypothetical protein